MTEDDQAPRMENGTAECTPESACPICAVVASRAGRWFLLLAVVVAGAFGVWRWLGGSEVDALLVSGEAQYQAREFDEAVRTFEEVIRRDPNQPLALSYLGIIARDRGEDDQAVRYFTRAAEVDPNTPQHHWNLACLHYEKRKDYVACEQALQQAMKLGFKAQYRLLYALCAVERGLPEDVIVKRLKDTVSVAEGQAHSLPVEALAEDGSLARVWKEAARRLMSYGNDFGYKRLEYQAAQSEKAEVRAFAKRLLEASAKGTTQNRGGSRKKPLAFARVPTCRDGPPCEQARRAERV